MSIRPARPKDLPALLELEQLFPSDRISRRQMLFHLKNTRALLLISDVQGTVAGYALFFRRKNRAVRFYSLVTGKKHRGSGHARALIEEGLRRLRKERAHAVTLEVRTRDKKTIEFYRRCGFVAGEVIPSYYADGHDALKMRKDLP